MVLRLIGVAAVCGSWGCQKPPLAIAPPPPSPIVRASVPIATVPDLDRMFALPTPAVAETRCRAFPLPIGGSRGVVGGDRGVVYDFMEMPLGAIERGPRTTARERRIDSLTNNELHRPFARRANHITRCWKWFAATHPGSDTHLDAHLVIDVFGATSAIHIVNRPEDADLAACIRDGFVAPLYVYGPRQREQHTQVTMHFVREDQPAWKTLPARPAPIHAEPLPERGTTCVRAIATPVASRLYPLRVTDFDPARIPPPPPPRRGRVIQAPALRVGCVYTTNGPKKADLRAAVKSNWGAYEACHADARARMPDLAGKVSVTLLFDKDGAEPTLATVTGDGDGEFHACLDRALEQIWLEPPTKDSLILANFVFPLVTDSPPAVRDLATWRALLANATAPLDGCTVRHELVLDRLAAAPWVDDARVREAFRELARFIGSLSRADASACLAAVDKTLRHYIDLDDGSLHANEHRVDPHLDRLEAVLELANAAPWGADLTLMLARAYRKDPARAREGSQMLEEMTLDPALDGVARVDERPIAIANTCAR